MPHRSTTSPSTQLAAALALAAAVAASACTPQRAPVTQQCNGNQHCPADGFWYCDLATHLCARCAGACPVKAIPDMDAGSLSDAVTPVSDATAADATTAAGDATSGAAGCDSVLPDYGDIGTGRPSCLGICGKEGGLDSKLGKACWCDVACEKNGDCCFDYQPRCGCLAVAGTDTCDKRCGDRTEGGKCQCDTLCTAKGDCCADMATYCVSCTGHCGQATGIGAGDNVCYCDEQCSGQGDCCYDRALLCATDGG